MSKKVITFHYTVKDTAGELIDSSSGSEPLMFLEGSGQIIPGLEKHLLPLVAGDKKTVAVPAAEAYGERDEGMIFDVPRTQFPKGEKIEVGMKFQAQSQDGHPSPVFTVVGLTLESIKVDGNHPLAGKDLNFDVEVVNVRAATKEELSHGHAHGGDGHHH